MRNRITTALLAALPALTLAAAQDAIRVDAIKISAPVKVAELDLGKLKGDHVSRMAWSPDGSQLYVQTMEGDFGRPPKKLRHYVLDAVDGARKDVDAEPEWATAYWVQKSHHTSPDAQKIDLKDEVRVEKAVSTPMGGSLARGGGSDVSGSSSGEAIAAASTRENVKVITLTFMGTAVGLFEGTPLVPGRTFGWGPKGSKAIAYADVKNGRLMIMDEKGNRQEVSGSKDAILPSWSQDGQKLAWLQKDGKKKHVLHIASLSKS
jgi:dipeptidyl aminopeptidase/acylaminoacyl peptidase